MDIRLNTEVAQVCMKSETAESASYVLDDAAEQKKNNGMNRQVVGVKTQKGEMIPADAVIVCTGGVSYASTGSTGDGYRFAEEAGMSLTEACAGAFGVP